MPPRFDENTQTFYLNPNQNWSPFTYTSTAIPISNIYNNRVTTTDNIIWETPSSYGNFITQYGNNYILDVSASNISNMSASFYDDRVCLIIKFSDIVEKEIGIVIKRNDPMFDYFMMLYSGWNEVQRSKSELKERKNKIDSFKTEDLNKDLNEFLKE